MTTFRTEPSRKETGTKKGRKNRKERFPFLLFLSCLIHATLIILLALLFAKGITKKPLPTSEPPPPQITLEISPPQPPERPSIEAQEIAERAPDKAPFQSDENTKAASELPPTGSLPIPTQQGVAQAAMELQTQRHTQGEQPATSAGNPAPPQPPSPSAPPTPPPPQLPPTQQQKQDNPTPAPTVTPQASATPQPTPTTPPPPNSVKLLEIPKDQPTPQPSPPQTAAAQHPPQPASPPSNPSLPGTSGSKKGYQPETRQTVIRGNISNRGPSSVAAEATPIGRFKKQVATHIGSRWYKYIDERMGLISIGTVSVTFKVTASGQVKDLRVISSNGNQSLTDCSLRSIMDAKLPPIPPEVAPTLQNGCLEIDYSFTIY